MKPRRCRLPRDLTGALRYVLVTDTAEKPRFRTHYPSEAVARSYAQADEFPVAVRVTGRGGPFSDTLERLDGGPV